MTKGAMNADRLLAHYERIADAPDAIARLRRFVLDLAVRGKLVPQNPKDEPASELLKWIAQEKARLVKVGELKAERELKGSTTLVEFFELPRGWAWTSLQSICLSISDGDHQAPPKSETGVPFLVIGDVRTKEINYDAERRVPQNYFDGLDPIRKPQSGDLLYTLVGSFGIPVPVRSDEPFCIQRHIGILRPAKQIDLQALAFFLESEFAFRQAEAAATGIAQKTVSLAGLRSLTIPLPPLAEQHRIVAKVDELMALCDRLEAARAEREKTRDRLSAASLARINAPDPDPATFSGHARFALDNLAALTTRPDQIKQLRQTILNLAVRGRLVEGSTARAAAVGDYRTLQNGYAFKSSWFSKEGVRLLRNANIGHAEIRWNDVVHLPKDRLSEFERFQLNEGDIVLTLDRPFIVTGTKVARVSAADLPCLLLQRVGRFVETSPGLTDDYLFLWINSPHFNEQIDPGRSNGVPHISSRQVEAAEIFVPQLAEQHRIVAKVDELMALCDRLEACITTGVTTSRRLLDALLAEALEPALQRTAEAAE